MGRPVTQSGDSALPLAPEEPMQLGLANFMQAMRLHRIQADECLYYGKPGHFLAHCPVRPKGLAHQ